MTAHHRARYPLRSLAWWVMRERVVFCLEELLLTVADGSERQAAENLRRYIRDLGRSGLLSSVPRLPGYWRLTRDLGPLAPIVRRAGDRNCERPVPSLVWDANSRLPVHPLEPKSIDQGAPHGG